MEQEVIYKASAKELKELLLEPLRREVIAEQRAKFSQIVDVETVAKIHGVHPDTIYAYLKSGDITCEPRIENGKYRFKLGNALEFDFKELRKQLKNLR